MNHNQKEILRITDLLARKQNKLSQDKIKKLQEDLAQYHYLADLWAQFQSVPVNRTVPTALGRLASAFAPIATDQFFFAGTPEETVLEWFETSFCLSVRDEFGYDGPYNKIMSCGGCCHASDDFDNRHACLSCRRCPNVSENKNRFPDLYTPEIPCSAAVNTPVVSTSANPSGDVLISVDTPLQVRVALTENDIFNWLTRCLKKDVLIRLSKTAAKYARDLGAEPDDFRSRT